jgi:phosphoheptose isomerase
MTTRIVEAALDDAIALHQRVRALDLSGVVRAAAAIREACAAGRKVLVFGNGGSAADAQHFAAELIGRFERERQALAALALTTDTSVLTSVANDDRYPRVFARQIEGLGRAGDVAVGITPCGTSPNVVEGLRTAAARGLRTVALTGRDGGEAGRIAEIHVNVPDPSAARVQEVQRTLIHAICRIVELDL